MHRPTRLSTMAGGAALALLSFAAPAQQDAAPAPEPGNPGSATREPAVLGGSARGDRRIRPQHAAARSRRGGERGDGRRRRSGRSPDVARGRAARGRARSDCGAAFGQRQGQPVFPARLQPRSRHRLHDLRRRDAVEPALAWPRARLPRRQRHDAGGRGAHRLPQRALPGRSRRLLDGRRLLHLDDRAARCAVRRRRGRPVRLWQARGRRHEGARQRREPDRAHRAEVLRRPVARSGGARSYGALGQIPAPDRVRQAGRHDVGLRRQLASRRSRSPSVRSAPRCVPTRSARSIPRPTATPRAGSAPRSSMGTNGRRRRICSTTTGTCSRIRPTTIRSISSIGGRRSAAGICVPSSIAKRSSSMWAASFATTTSAMWVSTTTIKGNSSRTFRRTRFGSRRSAVSPRRRGRPPTSCA